MTKDKTNYTEVQQRNGVTRRVPKEYHKPLGKTMTVSYTIPITIADTITQYVEDGVESTKSKVVSQLLFEAITAREQGNE